MLHIFSKLFLNKLQASIYISVFKWLHKLLALIIINFVFIYQMQYKLNIIIFHIFLSTFQLTLHLFLIFCLIFWYFLNQLLSIFLTNKISTFFHIFIKQAWSKLVLVILIHFVFLYYAFYPVLFIHNLLYCVGYLYFLN